MKTINVMMASLAALLVAACSQNEVTEVSPDAHPQMKSGVYTGTPTRGVDTDNNSIKDDPTDGNKYGGFGIMGYFTGSKGWNDAKASTAPGFGRTAPSSTGPTTRTTRFPFSPTHPMKTSGSREKKRA